MSQRAATQLDKAVVARTIQRFWDVTKKTPGMAALAVVTSVAYITLLTYINTWIMSLIVDRVQQANVEPDQVWQVFGGYIVALFVTNAAGQICSKLQDYSVYKLGIHGDYHLYHLCFNRLSQQSMTFHSNHFSGSLVSQTTRFVGAYSALVDVVVYSLIPTIASVVCTIIALGAVIPVFVVVLSAMLILYLVVATRMYQKIVPLSVKTSEAHNRLSGIVSDTITNILAVRTCGREDFETDLFNNATEKTKQAASRSMHAMVQRGFATSALITFIMVVTSIFVVGGNAWFGISAGSLVMIFTYTYQLSMRFNYINSMMARINRAIGEAAEMTKILDEHQLIQDSPDATELKVTRGSIRFDHVSFAYRDQDQNEKVFEDITLDIAAGQRIGIVGRSGSGKTTLTKLLLRLSDIQAGYIYIDGQDITHVTQKSLHHNIAYVPQEALLFHRSIRENIAYGRPDATDEQIYEAARQANALEFIEALPHGFATMVGERGIKLSGGQRQRIALARAILIDAPILVLDEATSALDSESEALIQDALAKLMHGRTALVIAHRLSTVATLDRIVVLHDGKIAEDGTHDQLISAGGEYSKLWSRQTGAFLDDALYEQE